jgi:hypothetical protein
LIKNGIIENTIFIWRGAASWGGPDWLPERKNLLVYIVVEKYEEMTKKI